MSSIKQAAKALGKRGGEKGSPSRAESLTAEQRSSIASEGGKAKAKSNA